MTSNARTTVAVGENKSVLYMCNARVNVGSVLMPETISHRKKNRDYNNNGNKRIYSCTSNCIHLLLIICIKHERIITHTFHHIQVILKAITSMLNYSSRNTRKMSDICTDITIFI